MNLFKRLVFLSTLATYFLIFIGGLVRVAGAGMGCPDWPKCFGSWIPPVSLSQLPAEIDPATFNMTLAWIEYFNRIIGMSVGLLIAATAVVALIKFRHIPRIVWPTALAAILTAFEGWMGAVVVASDLQPVIISAHMLIALVIVTLLLYVYQQTNDSVSQETSNSQAYPKITTTWALVLWLVAIVQIILGAELRGVFEIVISKYPLWGATQHATEVGFINNIHMIIGIGATLLSHVVGVGLIKASNSKGDPSRWTARLVMLLAVIQTLMGVMMMAFGLTPMFQLFHLWLGAMFVGATFVLWVQMKRGPVNKSEFKISAVPIVASIAVVIFLAAGSYAVVRQADYSRADIMHVKAVPEFEMTERSGDSFNSEQFIGKITVLDFFFTSCHGPCPLMTARMGELYDAFAHSDDVQFVSITVDPLVDSLGVLSAYATAHNITDDRWLFVRGEVDQTVALCEEGFLVSGDIPGMHSTKFILIDDRGEIRGYYDHDDDNDMKLLRAHIIELAKAIP